MTATSLARLMQMLQSPPSLPWVPTMTAYSTPDDAMLDAIWRGKR